MTRYTGNHCPVCEQAFTDTDDIVVCPDCGTPYHRDCWKKVGACMHRSEHAAGFEWQPEIGPNADKAAHEATCPNCGTRNTPGAARCSHCGCPLPRSEADSADAAKPEEQVPIYARDPSAVNNRSAAPGPHIETYSADREGGIYRREIGPEDTIDGIKAKDWAAYVGRSPMYYLMQFFRMSITNRKAAVCLSAFLFGPAYLFYRKMWKEGLLTAILTIVLSIPTFIEIISVFNPSLLGAMPLGWLPVAVNVCAVASWALNIILGLFAVSWYRREAKKNIDRIYADYPDGEARTDALLQKGGTNLLAALLYFGIMLLLASLVINLAGPGFVQYAMSISGY
ncbi:RING finger protein [Gemmiger sp.]|uniref:RING finger protein n=1 Tax=Gemmiger sp. TaxID=2049027 RepID=UPI003AB3896A